MKHHERAVWAGFLTALAVLVSFPVLAGSGLDDFGAAQGGGGGGGLATVSVTGDGLSGDGSAGDPLAVAADLEAIVDNWTMSTADVSGVGGIAQTGSVTLAGTGAQVIEGYRSRVYDYTGGSGNPTTLTVSQALSTITNSSASAAAYNTLPLLDGTEDLGLTITFVVDAAQELRIVANTGDTITVGSLTTAAAGYITSSTAGDTITLRAISTTKWVAIGGVGTWTGA